MENKMDSRSNNVFEVQSCWKWETGFPKVGNYVESDVFWYGGIERRFVIALNPKNTSSYFLCLSSRCDDMDTDPFELTVYIDGPKEPICFHRVLVEGALQKISSYHRNEVTDIMSLFKGHNVTFVFQFPGELTRSERQYDVQYSSDDFNDLEALQMLSCDFRKMFLEPLNYNAMLECEGELFKVHTDIVSARSSKFAELLRGWNIRSNRQPRLKIQDLDKASLRDILEYGYSGKLSTTLTEDSARRLYKATRIYSVGTLGKTCTNYLLKNLTHDNVCDILLLSDANDKDFRESIIRYIFDQKVILQERWLNFRKNNIQPAMEVYHKFYESHCNDA